MSVCVNNLTLLYFCFRLRSDDADEVLEVIGDDVSKKYVFLKLN